MAQIGRRQEYIRASNIKVIMRAIRNGGKTFAELEEITGLSNAAVFKIVSAMTESGMVLRTQLPSTTAGRRAEIITPNPAYGYFAVILAHSDVLTVTVNDYIGESIYKKEYETGYVVKRDVIDSVINDLKKFRKKLNHAKLPHYEDIIDIGDILLVENDKTYALIDKMFASLSKTFTSRIVNIGMDEAHYIGLGKYLDEHGYKNRYELLLGHLERVAEIADKYGFMLHMWSDMFFRIENCGKYYGKDLCVSENLSGKIPANVELVYWDYYHTETEDYETMMKAHKDIKNDFWFAGGAWCWGGFAPFNGYTLKSMKAAMQAVNKFNVKNVFITMWGDDGNF